MRRIITVCIITVFLVSCSSINPSEALDKESSESSFVQEDAQSQQEISDSSSSQGDTQSETSSTPETVFDTKFPIEALNIDKIEKASAIRAAWKDKESIYFIAQTYPDGRSGAVKWDSIQWLKYPIEVYHYNVGNNTLDKVYEYFTDSPYSGFYMQVQDTGDLAMKYDDRLIIVSAKDYKVIKDIQIPKDVHEASYNISYDGTKIAYCKKKLLKIIDSSTMKVLQTVRIPDAGYFERPTWSLDGTKILLHVSLIDCGPDHVVYVYDTIQNKLVKYDYSNNIESYDNQVFFVNDAKSVFRMDCQGSYGQSKVVVERYDLDTAEPEVWSFAQEMEPDPISISEKGFMIGNVFADYFYLLIADLNAQTVIKTENARSGAMGDQPVWARDQEKAIALFSVQRKSDAQHKWAAAIIDAKKIICEVE